MSQPTAIRAHLLDRLVPIFGKPQNVDGLADALAARCGTHVTPDALDSLANRIIEGRKAKGFPSASELIALVKGIPAPGGQAATGKRKYVSQEERNAADKAAEDAEKRAIAMLHSSDLASRAVAERWAPCLIEFVTKHGREPNMAEERDAVAQCRRNDVDADALRSEARGPFAGVARGYWQLRQDMHEKAARVLGFGDPLPQGTANAPRRVTREPVIPPIDPATIAPTDELLDSLGH